MKNNNSLSATQNSFQNRILSGRNSPPIYRPVFAEINHQNLKHNFNLISRKVSSKTAILSVVKANAYGHGLIPVSRTLSRLSKFLGVTSIEEALLLRKSGIRTPALILGNIYPFTNLPHAIQNDVRVTVASIESARMCDQFGRKLGKKVFAHAKIDTGMGRIGVNVRQALPFIEKILELSNVRLEGLYTHFSDSAEDPEFTKFQLKLFSDLVSTLKKRKIKIPFIHCANSGGIFGYPESRFSLVRPGISLYGVSMLKGKKLNLKPVLAWKSQIVFLKQVPARTPISYARTFVTKRKSKIATATFGYADGFRRSLSNNSEVLVQGTRVPVIGRVTMDMTMLDVTDAPHVRVGDEVVLIGTQGGASITVEEMADWAKTSPYEMLCGISARVPRIDIF